MIKIIGCVLLISAGTAAGFSASKKLSVRLYFFKSFLLFLSKLSTNLRYTQEDIFSAVSESLENTAPIKLESDNGNCSFEELWNKSVRGISRQYALEKNDIKYLVSFGEQLGTTDLDGQLTHIELYTQIFTAQLDDALSQLKSKTKMYRALGFFAGAAAAVIAV